MHPPNDPLSTKILPLKNLLNRSLRLRCGFVLSALTLAYCGLSPMARAQVEGVGNTAEGLGALENVTTGSNNTAIGFDALFKDTTGSSNTASGAGALFTNISGDNNTADGNNALFSNR